MGIELILSCLLTAASAGIWTGLIVYCFGSNKNKIENKKETLITEGDIYEYNSNDKIAIKTNGEGGVLSITAEETLRKLFKQKK